MKMSRTPFCGFALALAAAVLALSASAGASAVLEVDVSDPSAVTITATSANSLITEGRTPAQTGVFLLGLFTSDAVSEQIGLASGSSLTAGAPDALNRGVAGVGSNGAGDLRLFNDPGLGTNFSLLRFRTVNAAFTGSVALDLSAFSIASIGTMGDVELGFPVRGSVVGTYVVVPEPASLALLGLAGLTLVRRRRAG